MNDHSRIKKSHKLAILLRHDANYSFKEDGWREVSNVLKILQISFEDLEEIVAKDSKRRYAFNEEKTGIRAVYGYDEFIPHSPKTPADNYPDTLYHGTSLTSVASILEQGIQRMGRGTWKRAYVNLSADKSTALKVGARKGVPVVLCINTSMMTRQGYNLYEPESEPWTADEVPKESIGKTMFIGQTVAYYETDKQGTAIYDICTSSQTKEKILAKYAYEINAPIRSLICVDGVEGILNTIIYENNVTDRSIIAFLPINVNTDAQEYDRIQERLSVFIKGLQQSYIATPLLDLMADVKINNRRRALFYLEMSTQYKQEEGLCKMQIDWFDIRSLWKKSNRFLFYSPIIGDTVSSLLSAVEKVIETAKVKSNTSCVIWLDVPTDAAANYSEIMDFAWDMRQNGIVLLLGVNAINGQKFLANITIMEGA